MGGGGCSSRQDHSIEVECPLDFVGSIISLSVVNSSAEASPTQSHPHRFPHRGLLPEGRYFTLTWTIGYDFGGMTTVALERSSAFARLDNRRVEILTLSPEMKSRDRERELHEAGTLDRKVKIRNLWQDLTTWSDRKLRRMIGTVDPDPSPVDDVLNRSGRDWTELREDSEGHLLQADRYHDRGHLLVIDRQDMKKRGRRGGRRITLFGRDQKVIAQWPTARDFYHAWLDVVIGTKPSYLICDSAFVGNFIHEYRRDNVILSQVVHSHFVDDVAGDHLDELSGDKFGMLRHLDAFDVVAILTNGQREDMSKLDLAARSMKTISNLTENLHGDPTAPRPRGQGAMIARLDPIKRIEDAVFAMSKVEAVRTGRVSLDIFGEGDERPVLEELIAENRLQSNVVLHGHTPGAKNAFLTSSFSLLTSHSEGQALVVAESMSAGCIPICYDIDYRPAEVIDHGINGFVVPNGDVNALSETITHFLSMPENEVRQMRAKAIERAADFFEEAVIRRWGSVLAEQAFTSIAQLTDARAELISASIDSDGISIRVGLSGLGGVIPDDVFVSWKSRKSHFYGRVRAVLTGDMITADIPLSRIVRITAEYVDFSVDLVVGRGFCRVRIAGDSDSIVNRSDRLKLYSTKYGNLSGTFTRADLTSTS